MRHQIVILFVVLGAALSSCQEKPAREESKFVEFIEITGICRENHVKQGAEYSGSLEHWYDARKGRHKIYGDVHNSAGMVERVLDKEANPNNYHPPYTVEFCDLTPNAVARSGFTIDGLSKSLGHDTDTSRPPQHQATCHLRVVKRADRLPDSPRWRRRQS